MDKKLEQFFFAALGGALTVKDKLEANSDELKVWREKSEEQAVIIFVGRNRIVKNQHEKDNDHSKQGSQKSSHNIIQPGSAEYILIKSGKKVKNDPENWQPENTRPETGPEFNRNIITKQLGLNIYFTKNIEKHPCR